MQTKSDDLQVLCEWARDLGKTYAFLDFHVHPYDVLSEDTRYKPDPLIDGLFSRGLFKYHPPALETGSDGLPDKSQSVSDNQRAFILSSRFTYNHTGPKVFADQIELVGLAGVMLLPVARTSGKAEEMLEVSRLMFLRDGRLLPGCAFPVGVQPDQLAGFFKGARDVNGIRAIKLHPNLAGINPLTQVGQDLIHASLAAAGDLNLPMIVHAGRTPCIEPVDSREFGTMTRLALVDWGISAAPVILAHAGCYGLTLAESNEALLIIDSLLEKHSNLMVDVSNLEPPIIRLVLEKISPDRLIFGSDALYIPIWKAWIRFLKALQMVSAHPDDDLIRIASLNPAQCLSLTDKSARISL